VIYKVLDIFFVLFHSSLILFNTLGWIWKKTRLANLITLILTGFSWFFIGMIVGVSGYCPLTDWHFSILEKLGNTALPDSYIKYLADKLTGFDFNPELIDRLTLVVFLISLFISAILNIKDYFLKGFRTMD